MKALCLYYSRTNTTRVIMKRMAMLLDADLVEYTDGVDRSGFKGYIKSCIDSFKKPPQVHLTQAVDWDAYDTVIVAMPIWSEMPSAVGKGFLEQYSSNFKGDVYLVVTHMAGIDYDKAIRKIYKLCANEPRGYLSLQTKNHDPDMEIKRFVRSIKG